MIFKGKGNIKKPVILLLHGGGLSDWSLENIVNQFTSIAGYNTFISYFIV